MSGLSVESLPVLWRRRLLAGTLVLGVVVAHGVLLAWAVPAWFDAAEGVLQQDLQPVVHRVTLALVSRPRLPEPPPVPRPAQVAEHPLAPSRPAALRGPSAAPADAATSATVPSPEVEAVSEAVAAAPVEDIPVYAPLLPRAGTWRYRMARGAVSGQATLSWAPQPDGRYEARLEGRAAGLSLLDWVSHGVVDASGTAPDRFALRRRGLDRQAANFQRDAGTITFSGPTHELPLRPGVQDRLSWLVQLAGVLEGEPLQRQPGAQTTLMVVGARGGAERWSFVVLGLEPMAGRPALRLLRDTARRHETRVELWVDPAQGYRPLRAVLTTIEGGPPFVLDTEPEAEGVPVRP